MQFADPEVTIPAKAARFKARVRQAIEKGMVAPPVCESPHDQAPAVSDPIRSRGDQHLTNEN